MILELNHLTHHYGDETALEDVSMGCSTGEIVGVLGPSGSGKTTLVQAIAGHVTPTEGRIHLRSRDVTTDPPETREVGVVFQEPTLFPHMTVTENVAYGLKARGIDPDARDAVVREYLDLVSLTDQRAARPSALSGGQKRRVELARALAPEPDVLLLDEPLSALDRTLREGLRDEIARIQEETGVTTLYVTHDQDTAMALSDRLVVLTDGEVAATGPPRELYESPPSPFMATFLGQSTNLPVSAVPESGFTPASTPIVMDGGNRLPNEGSVECLARPADITLRGPDAIGGDVCLPGVVTGVEDFGMRYQVSVELDSGDALTVEQRSVPPATGDRVTVTVDPEDLMVFETAATE